MPQDYLERLQQLDKPWFYKLAWFGGAFLFLLAAVLWWQVVSVAPERVFWGTINNNLVTTSVTKHTTTKEEGSSLDQYQQLNLGAQNMVRSTAVVTEQQGDLTNKVTTETIATPDANFARYTSIETSDRTSDSKPFDFSPVLTIWSKEAVENNANGAFAETIFGIVPFAFLNAPTRAKIVSDMKQNKVYDVDYSALVKRHEGGKLIYDYTVSVSPEQYVKILKQVDEAMGLDQLKAIDVTQYQGNAAVPVKISIDAHAQQITAIDFGDESRKETFSAYGAINSLPLPAQTITREELQNKLNAILNAQ